MKHIFTKHKNPLLVVGLLSVVGTLALVAVNAADNNIAFEAETAQLTTQAVVAGDSDASAGQYVHFTDPPPQFGFSTSSPQSGPLINNVASNGWWTWPTEVTSSGADRLLATVKAPSPTTGGEHYWSSGFSWSNRSSGGYMGIQTTTEPFGVRGAIFSIWDVTVGEAVGNGVAIPFGGEGVGMKTARAFNWDWNVEYEYVMERDAARSDAQFNWWKAFVVEKSSQGGIEIGRIRSPAAWGYPVPTFTFLERFIPPSSCSQIHSVNGVFTDLQARVGGTYYQPSAVRVELREFDHCTNVFSASGLEDGYRIDIVPGTPQ